MGKIWLAELTRSYLCPSLGKKSSFSKPNTHLFHDASFEKTLNSPFHSDFKLSLLTTGERKNLFGVLPSVVSV